MFAHAIPEQQLMTGQYGNMRRRELFDIAVSKGLISRDQPTPTAASLRFMLEAQTTLPNAQLMTEPQAVPLNIANDPEALKKHIAELQGQLEALEPEKDPVDDIKKMTDFLSLGSPDGRGQVMAMKAFLKKECDIELENGSTKEDCVEAYEKYLESASGN